MAKKRKKADAPEVFENCRWWEPIWDSGSMHDYDPDRHVGAGECWRYPPTVPCMEGGIIEEHGIMVTDHPLVLWDGWCGEFRRKKES